ncbi:hypothetical protein [Streptomyces sp. Tu6071]|uniref:hypothetical protein n=1 Tax=Streptomyces sp. Tu6071 TaxID=355249 RepID=UPI00131A2521|nr:hypothetical protein [Streptomyces sp. Tu6071]
MVQFTILQSRVEVAEYFKEIAEDKTREYSERLEAAQAADAEWLAIRVICGNLARVCEEQQEKAELPEENDPTSEVYRKDAVIHVWGDLRQYMFRISSQAAEHWNTVSRLTAEIADI